MSANAFIGVHVTVTLHNGNIVSGTITNVDLSRNALLLKTDTNGKIATLDRSRIASLSTTPAPAAVETAQTASSSSYSTPAYDSAPDVAHLPTPSSGHSVGGVGGGGKHSSKAAKNNGKSGKKSSKRDTSTPASHHEYTPPPMEDFDFEASAKSFDKAKIWEQIRAQDQSDPAGLLVSHNRRSAGAEEGGIGRSASPAVGGGMMRKLRPDENVLSPAEAAAGEGVAAAASPTAAPTVAPTATTPPADTRTLERENALLKRRIHILQSLSGLTLDAEEDQQRSPAHDDAHDDALVSLRCTATTSVKDQHLAFTLLSSLEERDSKIRFKPSDGGAALPEKYNREMGLRLDNGSARVFLERLRAAAAEGQQQ